MQVNLFAKVCEHETATQLIARTKARLTLSSLGIPLLPSKRTQLVELVGEESSGKTELMLHAACRCVLPAAVLGSPTGGQACHVVWIDTGRALNTRRARQVLTSMLAKQLAADRAKSRHKGSAEDWDVAIAAAVEDSLARLHCIRCFSSSDLLAALHRCWELMHATASIQLLCIDGLEHLYWMERSKHGHDTRLESSPLFAGMARCVRALMEDHFVSVLVCRASLFTGKHGQFSENFPACWSSSVMQRIELVSLSAPSTWRLMRQLKPKTRGSSPARYQLTRQGVVFHS